MISVAGAAGKSANETIATRAEARVFVLVTIGRRGAAVGGDRAFDFQADPEARGIAEIGSKGRPQAVRTANRMARANCARVKSCPDADMGIGEAAKQGGES